MSRLSVESGAGTKDTSIDSDGFPSLLEQVNRLIVRRYALNDATRVIDLALHYLAVGSSSLPGHLGGTQTSLPAKIASDILSLFVKSNGFDAQFSLAIISLLENRNDQLETNTAPPPTIEPGSQISLLDPLPPMK